MDATDRQQLTALAAHFRARRDDLLRAWRRAVRADPELTTLTALPRSSLDDHFPKIVERFEHRLTAEHALEAVRIEFAQRKDAEEHGNYRWRQGYDLREAVREWYHLRQVLSDELKQYTTDHPDLHRRVAVTALEALDALCFYGIGDSVNQYAQLHECDAASRVLDLQTSLNALQVLENERAALLRETAHDLRDSVGILENVTAALASPEVATDPDKQFHDLLRRRIHSMGVLLAELVELGRLEAGQDPLRLEAFDAAARLREYCDLLRPVAAQRKLFLRYEGPESLKVEGDPLKLLRIVQNLLLNAIGATVRGGVVIRCLADEGGDTQWTVCIDDTGSGFDPHSAGPLGEALKEASEHAPARGAASTRRRRRSCVTPAAPFIGAGRQRAEAASERRHRPRDRQAAR